MILITYITYALGLQIDFLELPSPAYVAERARLRRQKEYENALKLTSTLLERYKNCNSTVKEQLISKWYEQIWPDHVRYTKDYSNGILGRIFEESLSGVDMTKLDLLLLTEGKSPVFHTEGWIRYLYSNKGKPGSPFTVQTKNIEVPYGFSMSRGGTLEPPFASFDQFFVDESKMVKNWIDGKFVALNLQPMTNKKMFAKMK